MDKTSSSVNLTISDSLKRIVIPILVTLGIVSILTSFLILVPENVEGAVVGRIIAPLFLLSEFPILINFFFQILNRLRFIQGFQFRFYNRIMEIFSFYYPVGLIFHSSLFTIVIGLLFSHTLVLIQKAGLLCLLLIGIPVFLWIFDFLLWMNNWPLYPTYSVKLLSLIWLYWFILFGFLIGIVFHAKIFSIFWIGIISMMLIVLIGIIFLDVNKIKTETNNLVS